ncbi:hypothetical protein DERF_006347 [Dermatophagoides farinae]|uniref:Uncharacterized protein n=1 Tax=Dermatophagoides farinae TaxID=6954 RepID=A0A922I8P9_DERFA|nr:hypothetical protein DERF_006347 [Dermatophagoides farinae]
MKEKLLNFKHKICLSLTNQLSAAAGIGVNTCQPRFDSCSNIAVIFVAGSVVITGCCGCGVNDDGGGADGANVILDNGDGDGEGGTIDELPPITVDDTVGGGVIGMPADIIESIPVDGNLFAPILLFDELYADDGCGNDGVIICKPVAGC